MHVRLAFYEFRPGGRMNAVIDDPEVSAGRKWVVITEGRQSTIVLSGHFPFSRYPEFWEVARLALSATADEIVLDMSELLFLNSAAIGMLLSLRQEALAAGKRVVIAHATGDSLEKLKVARLTALFQFR